MGPRSDLGRWTLAGAGGRLNASNLGSELDLTADPGHVPAMSSAARLEATTAQGADPAQEPAGADGWALLDALRRRLDDQGAQTRKTAAQVQQLAESIGALVAQQRRRARWLNINSFVAYLIFTVLCGGAFYFLYESRANELIGERDKAAGERDQAVRRADDAAGKLAAREAADAKALAVWQLFDAGKRDEAQKQLAALGGLSKLDADVLAARAKDAQLVQVDVALKSAAAASRAGKLGEAIATLEGALALQGAAARAGELHYQIATAELKLKALDKAAQHFQAAVAADVSEEDARYQLAGALDQLGQWAKARAEYDRFATAHPQSASAVWALRRSAMLAHMPAQAPWVGAAAGAAVAVPPAAGMKPVTPPTSGAPTNAPATAPAVAPAVVPASPKPDAPAAPRPDAPAASVAPTVPAAPASPPSEAPATAP